MPVRAGVLATSLRAAAPLLAAAALTGVALLTVTQAGCDDPGRFVAHDGGYELVGSCVAPGDLVVPGPAPDADPASDPDAARG